MQEQEYGYTIEELAERVGVPVRTIRFYIAEGLLMGPGTRGKATSYGIEHLLRLQLIRRLSERHIPLAEMREMLSHLTLDEIRALLAEEEERSIELQRKAQIPSPKEYLSTLLNKAQAARQPAPSPPASAPRSGTESREYLKEKKTIEPGKGEEWLHWELAPGVELHVNASVERQQHILIERLLELAHRIQDHKNS